MSRQRLVLDASAALHLCLSERPTSGLERYGLVAPALFLSERTSALASAAYRTSIPPAAVEEAFDRLEAMAVRIIDSDAGHRRAVLELARRNGWAKTYDAEYVALAQRFDAPLLTTDERLVRGAGHLVAMLDPRSLVA